MAKSYDEYRLGEPHEPPRRKGLKTVVIVAALMAITILPAMAAKGGAGGGGGGKGGNGGSGGGTTTGGGTIALKMMDPTDTVPNTGDYVTFTISTTATQYPYVQLLCYANGSQVVDTWQGFFPTALGHQYFLLGAVDSCTANLEMYNTGGKGSWQTLNSTSFQVSP
jgi:hypothetical protein